MTNFTNLTEADLKARFEITKAMYNVEVDPAVHGIGLDNPCLKCNDDEDMSDGEGCNGCDLRRWYDEECYWRAFGMEQERLRRLKYGT